ncbi:MAG: hypothetical protein KKB30_05075 [Proteobacteria bacterium]|nr:hypothetical protein [Pseudomonadota bacterium]MBU1714589.1 hypothetical protein [Pseudomonadota bacterium]
MNIYLRQSILVLFGVVIMQGYWVGPVIAARKEPVKVSSQEARLMLQFKEREDSLKAREQALDKKEQDLALVSKEVDDKLVVLISLQEDLQNKLDELKKIKDKRFSDLIKVYSAMSASKLAPLLNLMEDDEVSEVLRAMKTDIVAKIVPKLDQEKAVRVSKILGMIK